MWGATSINPTSWNKNSRKFVCRILHIPAPIPLESPSPGTPHSPAPLELVTPMDRYARSWIPSDRKLRFVVAILGARDGAERDYSLKIRRLLHTSWESG
jgi:hypothetical protein